jgi:hypothetical protein
MWRSEPNKASFILGLPKEAFCHILVHMQIPEINSRLRWPVVSKKNYISTSDKN